MRTPPTVEIRKTIRGSLPRVPFEDIARTILGQRYQLSLVICGEVLAERMNRVYRKKNYSPNVLSFPLDTYEGEIFLNVRVGAREARRFHVSLRQRLTLLFIHGCFHLKGMKHGTRMERLEEKTLRKFT